ncbi:MAG: radical SAM protein [Candidatus Saganbacteria bacterium]|nr:radical SAM protein [Candidatus Saganbacteria bacterium]
MFLPFLNLGKQALFSNFNLLADPYKLTFAITYRCNGRCSTCNIWQREKKDELSLDEIATFFEKNKFSWINLTGGEPFLRPDLVDIIRIITAETPKLYFLNFTSNGLCPEHYLKEAEKIRSVITIPKFAIGVSIEGPPEIDEKIKGVAKSFTKAIETFKGLKKIFAKTSYQPFISYTISPQNLGRLKETISAIRSAVPDFKLTQFHVNLFHFSDHYYGNQRLKTGTGFDEGALSEIENFLALYRVPANPDTWIEKKYLKLLISFLEKGQTPLPCQALRASCYIGPSGDIYPCALFDKKLGNLKNCGFDLSRLWNLDETRKIRQTIRQKECPNCWTPCEAYQTILGDFLR